MPAEKEKGSPVRRLPCGREMATAGSILVINAGSSSVKFTVHDIGLTLRLRGQLSGLNGDSPHLSVTRYGAGPSADTAREKLRSGSVPDPVAWLLQWLRGQSALDDLAAVGHRIALGGLDHTAPELLTDEVLRKLHSLVPLAPLHQPRNLEPVETIRRLHPSVPQVACFDTAFHRTVPHIAELYGLPRRLAREGARRYGFHGLSYEYIAARLSETDPKAAAGRTIIAHLGSGASMCALRNGQSIATTMGFSPLSGIVMATRPGDLDPGLLIWLLREKGMSVDEVERMLYTESGLRGVSGLSGDMRELLASRDARAREAVDLFVYRVSIEMGALCAALGGLDAIVFTAGIGEHSHFVRKAVCERLDWLGIRVDQAANRRGGPLVSSEESSATIWTIPTDEESMIARHTARVAGLDSPGARGA